MKLEIQDAIQSLITPEQLAVILDAVELLLEKDYGTALDELNTVLMIADDDADSTMLVGRIMDILTYATNFILNNHDIIVSDDAPLAVRVAVINAIHYIPLYIIPDDLAHIFQQQYDSVETLAQIVAFFSDFMADDLIEYINDVGDNILAYLKTVVDTRVQLQGEAIGLRSPVDRIRIINRLVQTVGKEKFSMMLELANAGVRVGRSYDELLHISFENLESRSPDDAAAQMVGLAFFSDMPLPTIWSKLNLTLDDYTDNPMERKLMTDEIHEIRRKLGDLNANS